MFRKLSFALSTLLTLASLPLAADINLPRLFTNNMVLQQQESVNIWGNASPGETVAVTGSWDNETVSTVADANGDWMVQLQTIAADHEATPYTINFEGNNSLTLSGVVMGEVWLLGGQSNMELPLSGWGGNDPAPVEGGSEAIAASDLPNLRLFWVGTANAATPQRTIPNHWADWNNVGWRASSPSISGNFSALGFFFGREIQETLNVPVGLIQDCWGGSSCEAWAPPANLNRVKEYNGINTWNPSGSGDNQTPSVLYNAMIHPVIPFTVRGVLWYQGETNMGRMEQLSQLFPEMIQGWRKLWGQESLPFCFALLAPYDYWAGQLPEFWEAQANALSLPDTGMVVTVDVGDIGNIHPAKKEPVGHRMALWARATVYGEDIEYSGPIYRSMEVEGSAIRLHFDHVGNGLKSVDGGELTEFEIAGENGNFVTAQAIISGDTVVVSSASVSAPTQARYAWSKTATGSLCNEADLPAAPFRTRPSDYVPTHFGRAFRPASAPDSGLFVRNEFLRDASDTAFTPYGVAMELDATAEDILQQFNRQLGEITSLSEGNALAIIIHLGDAQSPDTLVAPLQEILFSCIQADITPIISLHLPDGSDIGDEAALWTEPAILEVINRFENYAAIYYGTPGEVALESWSTRVNADLTTLRNRNGGTQMLIMVEGPDGGGDPDALADQYPTITDSNLAFGIVPGFDFTDVNDMDVALDHLKAERIPVIFCGVAPDPNGEKRELVEALMEDCTERNFGYILSMWSALDDNEDPSLIDYNQTASLSSWGQAAVHGDFGINDTAHTAAFFDERMTFQSWAALRALTEGQDSMVDDPDLDGLDNEMEYFHALNPLQSEGRHFRTIEKAAGETTWTLHVNDDAKDAWFATIAVSSDMLNWTEGTLLYAIDSGEWQIIDAPEDFPSLKSASLTKGVWSLTMEADSETAKFSNYDITWVFEYVVMDP